LVTFKETQLGDGNDPVVRELRKVEREEIML
jgi:hypothetical protein